MSTKHRPYTYQLTKFERNDLFRAIEGIGIPLVGFELSERREEVFITGIYFGSFSLGNLGHRASRPITMIRHQETASVFGVAKVQYDSFRMQYETAGRRPEWMVLNCLKSYDDKFNWSGVLGSVRTWADDIWKILDDAKLPDLWSELQRGREFLGGQPERDMENTPFTAAERTEIYAQMLKTRTWLRSRPELALEQVSRVEARLDYLEKASERVGRKDWLMMFNGAVTSLILSDLLPSQTAQHIIMLTVHGLAHLFGMGGPPPHLPSGGVAG
jgi:hypothetical protein